MTGFLLSVIVGELFAITLIMRKCNRTQVNPQPNPRTLVLTQHQREQLAGLSRCTMLTRTYDRAFVRSLLDSPPDHLISENEAKVIERLYQYYHWQIDQNVEKAREKTVAAPESPLKSRGSPA